MDRTHFEPGAIHFDRYKYGRLLLADAGSFSKDFPDLITGAPDAHWLAFHEIALITEGRGTMQLDGTPLEVAPYRLCITAPRERRTWRLSDAPLDGMIAFFEAGLFTELFADPAFVDKFPVLTMDASKRSIPLTRNGFDRLAGIVAAMREELRNVQADSAHVLRAHGYLLLTELQRQCGERAVEPLDKARVLSQRFVALVEQNFLRGDNVADYAALLGVTTRHLNHCVRAATGTTAGEVIQRRLHLEARRLLLNTDQTIVEIAQALNFSDPSYFNRFFTRHAGVTPRAFRVQHGSPIFSPNRPLRRSER